MSQIPAFLLSSCLLLLSPVISSPVQAGIRAASMNLCADQLLLALSERQDIVSVSYLSADADFSPVAAQVRGLHLNHGQAEELLPLQPGLVVTGQFSASLAAGMLERLGYRVLRQPVAASAEDIYQQISTLAEALERQAAGQTLISRIQSDIASYSAALGSQLQGKRAVFFSSNGFTYGSNTLQHAFLTSLGMQNAAAELIGPARLSLEQLISLQPDYLIINPPSMLDRQLAHPLLQHPVLAAVQNKMQTLVLPDAWFQCAGPQFVQAYQDLAEQL